MKKVNITLKTEAKLIDFLYRDKQPHRRQYDMQLLSMVGLTWLSSIYGKTVN